MNELITVRQLPVIEEHLRSLGAEIDKKVSDANALVCTEGTVKDVKAIRADLNRQFSELEDQRKAVKAAVLGPYDAFEAIYKECVSSKFKSADGALREKINDVEDGLKSEKEADVVGYFAECCAAHHIDWLTFDRAEIRVTLSASAKSLKEQARKFVEQVADDIAMASSMENSDEIMVEYQRTLRLAPAVQAVRERHKAMEEAQRRRESMREAEEKEKSAERVVESVSPATEVSPPDGEQEAVPDPEQQILTLTFHVTATKEKLRKLKQFLEIGEYSFK